VFNICMHYNQRLHETCEYPRRLLTQIKNETPKFVCGLRSPSTSLPSVHYPLHK
jgi:methyl coenzyme M reductase gamma subunit